MCLSLLIAAGSVVSIRARVAKVLAVRMRPGTECGAIVGVIESEKVPIAVVTIEKAERPSEN